MTPLRRTWDWIVVGLAVMVPFWFLRTSMRDPRQDGGVASKLLLRVITPVQYAAATLARGVSGVWGDYVYLVDVREDNTKLAYENARLRDRVRKLEQAEAEARRLRRLLGLRTHVAADLVSALVISKDPSEFFRVVRVTLDRDARDVAVDMPVITLDGVVGTTRRVTGDTIDVRLVVDAGSAIDVVVERTGARGIVRGTGDERRYSCRVDYAQRTDEIEVGDLLVTSGVGRRFPRGLPVARVTEVVKRDFGIYQQVVAVPVVDFSRLEEVLIAISPASDTPFPAPERGAAREP